MEMEALVTWDMEKTEVSKCSSHTAQVAEVKAWTEKMKNQLLQKTSTKMSKGLGLFSNSHRLRESFYQEKYPGRP